MNAVEVNKSVAAILNSRKYRGLDIPEETVAQLLQTELDNGIKLKAAVKNVRQKMHNIIAPYLGDPDYEAALQWLDEAYANSDPSSEKQICEKLLNIHASTRERMPHLESFYECIFSTTGTPNSILDLACAMHPFSIPWMNLPSNCEYHAYDLHQPRINLINHFLNHHGFQPLAEKRDILINPPNVKADIAFLFKETHRLEQRQQGCNLPLWKALNVDWLVVTLPAHSLNSRHNLRTKHRNMIQTILKSHDWLVKEEEVGGELIFFMQPKRKNKINPAENH